MTRTRSAVLMIYAALTPALVRANRKSSERRILATLIFFRVAIEESFAKCGNVDYSWGADALASAHDYAVTMMLYEIFGQNHTHISYLQIKLKVLVNHL